MVWVHAGTWLDFLFSTAPTEYVKVDYENFEVIPSMSTGTVDAIEVFTEQDGQSDR